MKSEGKNKKMKCYILWMPFGAERVAQRKQIIDDAIAKASCIIVITIYAKNDVC